jgi:hypothetical protein
MEYWVRNPIFLNLALSSSSVLWESEKRKQGHKVKRPLPTKNIDKGRAPVAHTYNPSYSGGRDQEDHGLKPGQGNSSQDPISKMPIMIKGLMEWLKVKALSSSPVLQKKKKEKEEKDRQKPEAWGSQQPFSRSYRKNGVTSMTQATTSPVGLPFPPPCTPLLPPIPPSLITNSTLPH